MKGKIIFVSGIDTDAGKTYATGWLARKMRQEGTNAITVKMIQTGNCGYSEDIEAHRAIMAEGLFPEDREGLTAPQIFKYPSSAQLAAKLEGRDIDLAAIVNAVNTLAERYDHVLVEGAGGLMVPFTDDLLCIDFVAQQRWPTLLTTSSRLGSINHTLLSIEALQKRGINIEGFLYNTFHDADSPEIAADTKAYLQRHYPAIPFIEIPVIATVH